MATTFHFTVSTTQDRCTAADQVLAECHKVVHGVEEQLSEYLPHSPVYQLNHAPEATEVLAGEFLSSLFETAETLRSQTDNAFHYGAKGVLCPNPPFHLQGRLLKKLHPQAWLGFGAIGKGYALDKARELLAREGFEDFCLNAGGSSILLSGYSSPNQPWSWGWSFCTSADAKPLGMEFLHETGRPLAIGVSGMQEKGAHLLRPQMSARETKPFSLQSALVAAASATEADALSTALFVSGWDAFQSLPVVGERELATAAIDDSGHALWNGWFKKWWGNVTTAMVFSLAVMSTPALAEVAPIVDAAKNAATAEKADVTGNDSATAPAAPAAPAEPAEASDAADAADAANSGTTTTDASTTDATTTDTTATEAAAGGTEEAIDLSDLGIEQFNPTYLNAIPFGFCCSRGSVTCAFAFETTTQTPKHYGEQTMKKLTQKCFATLLVCLHLEQASAVEFEKLGAAVAAALKTTKAFKASTKVGSEDTTVFYSKDATGKANRFAVVQKGIYKPNCSHTWVVAVNNTTKVEEVRVVEMSCTHAYPTRKPSFLAQFKGKGPAAVRELASSVQVVAKPRAAAS